MQFFVHFGTVCLCVLLANTKNLFIVDIYLVWSVSNLYCVPRQRYYRGSQSMKFRLGLYFSAHVRFIAYHVIVFMPLTNPCSPWAVHNLPYCPLSGLIILHDIPRHLIFELDHVRKCSCKMIPFSFSFVSMYLCVIDCDEGNTVLYTPKRRSREGMYYGYVLCSWMRLTQSFIQ